MLFKNATIYTMEQDPFVGDFRIDKGVFTEIGKDLNPKDEEVQDLNGLYVFPGLIDAHSHLGMVCSSVGFEGEDGNEVTDPITPNIRGIDGCNPMDETIEEALKSGVTTVAVGPGSANVIGGTFFAYKTAGHCIDEMTIQNPLAMKAAFGENPKAIGAIWGCMGYSVLLCFCLFKTGSVAKSIFGTHQHDDKIISVCFLNCVDFLIFL